MIRNIVIALILLVGSGLGGYYLGRGQKEIQVVEKEGKTVIQYKDRIVTVIRTVKPDGTVTEITKTEEKSRDTEIDTRSTSTDTKSLASNYSLGVKYWLPISVDIINPSQYSLGGLEVTGGYRLVGDSWLDLGVKLDRSVALGLSVKF